MVPVRERLTVLVALRVLERDVEIEMVIDVVSGTLSVLVDVKVAVRVGAADTVSVLVTVTLLVVVTVAVVDRLDETVVVCEMTVRESERDADAVLVRGSERVGVLVLALDAVAGCVADDVCGAEVVDVGDAVRVADGRGEALVLGVAGYDSVEVAVRIRFAVCVCV
jgi:hypothetical protein